MSKPIRRTPASSTNHRQVEQDLRQKIKELEWEVKSLKSKLDELRKAKNITLVKKEKEFVTTVLPSRPTEPKIASQKVESSDSNKAQYLAEIDKLNKELEKFKISPPAAKEPVIDCGHEEIVVALQGRLSDVESINTALSIQNDQLQERLAQAYDDVSKKEAEHCEALERTKTELQAKWQEMYKEWMRTTEAKIQELQAANDMLNRMLQRTNPNS